MSPMASHLDGIASFLQAIDQKSSADFVREAAAEIERLRGKDVVENVGRLEAENERLKAELEEMRARKDGAYEERNMVVAALARAYPSGIKSTAIEGWSDDWHGCVYIDLPTGQASWHYHDSQRHLFAGLPQYQGEWDGHTTEQKYQRLVNVGENVG